MLFAIIIMTVTYTIHEHTHRISTHLPWRSHSQHKNPFNNWSYCMLIFASAFLQIQSEQTHSMHLLSHSAMYKWGVWQSVTKAKSRTLNTRRTWVIFFSFRFSDSSQNKCVYMKSGSQRAICRWNVNGKIYTQTLELRYASFLGRGMPFTTQWGFISIKLQWNP